MRDGSTVASTKKLSLKDCSYMFTVAWETLTKDNLKNGQKKLWPIGEKQIEESPAENKRVQKTFYINLHYYISYSHVSKTMKIQYKKVTMDHEQL